MPWSLDHTHLDVGFSAKHLMVATVRGRFRQTEAEMHIDEEHPERSFVLARIDVASLDTGNPERDAHLKSPDFLDAARFPEMVFRSSRVSLSGERIEILGDLQIREVSHPVTLNGEFAGPVSAPWGGRSVGFELAAEIDREAWGLTWNVALEAGGVLVSRTIKLQITAEIVEQSAAA